MPSLRRFAILVTSFVALPAAFGVSAAANIPSPAGLAEAAPGTLTLITGDRLTLRHNADTDVEFHAGPGRENVPYFRTVVDRQAAIVPADAMALYANGTLDASLFKPAKLNERRTGESLPLLITYGSAAAAEKAAHDGLPAKQLLPSGNSVVITVPQRQVGEFWRNLQATPGKLKDGITRISLDGAAKPMDADSTPQIGAPMAWSRGLTARGVKVAILDTGADRNHPALAGRILAARDFAATDQNGVVKNPDDITDLRGHGTHVAGIVAGSGAQPGVAPSADLLIGRVCDGTSCPRSAIMAAIRWAAESGAKVINLSVGEPLRSDGTDEFSQTLNKLSDSYGVLFVVAAGNYGIAGEETVTVPAIADRALAVGSVTKFDSLSYISSRGPRADDYAVKPDISAPGHSIVSALAQGSGIGYPIGDGYTEMSGTSMAAPHVTGAAAILVGQHPDWSPSRLKAVLTSTAEPAAEATVYQQGTGVVDIDRATRQHVFAEPSSLNLTKTRTGTITYYNDGDRPVSLKLELPAELRADRATVDIPAKGSTDVTVTATTTNDSGLLVTARSGDDVVRTAVAAHSLPVTRRLTVHTIDRAGVRDDPAQPALVIAASKATGTYHPLPVSSGEPAGAVLAEDRYTVFSWVPSAANSAYTLVSQDVDLRGESKEVTLDARGGRKVATTLNGVEIVGTTSLSYGMSGKMSLSLTGSGETYVVPSKSTSMVYIAAQYLRNVPGSDACGLGSKAVCHLATAAGDGIVASHPVLADRDLATVRSSYGDLITTGSATRSDYATRADTVGPPAESSQANEVSLPSVTTSYFFNSGEVGWRSELQGQSSLQLQAPRTYPAGRETREFWLRNILGPSVSALPVIRDGDLLTQSGIALFSDSSPGHYGYASQFDATGKTLIYRDGKSLQRLPTPDGSTVQMPPGKARYRIESTSTRPGAFSTAVSATWEFESDRPATAAALPLLAVQFSPLLDDRRTAPGGQRFSVPFRVDRTATAGAARQVSVDVSYDDGASWRTSTVTVTGDHGTALIDHPSSGWVSLRAQVTDSNGNTVEQTILRAYGLR